MVRFVWGWAGNCRARYAGGAREGIWSLERVLGGWRSGGEGSIKRAGLGGVASTASSGSWAFSRAHRCRAIDKRACWFAPRNVLALAGVLSLNSLPSPALARGMTTCWLPQPLC